MSRDEANALLALKNAWLGVADTAGELQAALPGIEGLAADTPLKSLDLETYHRKASAHATSVLALKGLIDELQRQAARE
jgi:hypothetical protein